MSELKFNHMTHEEHKTISVYVDNAIIDIKESDYIIKNRVLNKYKQSKANIKILNDKIKTQLKIWEEQINEYLKCEVGTGAVKILYENMIYPKVEKLTEQEEAQQQFKIKSIWINENNKPFVQLYYINHTT